MRTTNWSIRILSSILLFAVLETTASADILTFNDRTAWESAAGSILFEEDFEGFAQDVDFSFGTTTLPNGFSVSHSGPSDVENLIDANSIVSDLFSNAISAWVEFDGFDIVTLDLDNDVSAFGFETSGAAISEETIETFFDSNNLEIANFNLGNGNNEFVGVTASGGTTVSRVVFTAEFSNSGGEVFRIDNVVAATQIPEPGLTSVLLAGLMSVTFVRRKRKA